MAQPISGAARQPGRTGRSLAGGGNVQCLHIHFVVEAPDQVALTRAMKGLEVRMARALNKVMDRKGPVFSDRYHVHLLRTPGEARHAWDYVLSNWRIHAARAGQFVPKGNDPYSSAADPAGTRRPEFWMLRVGIWRRARATALPSSVP